MINNLELIKPLLIFDSNEYFYQILIMTRNKDIGNINTEKSQKHRIIKEYYIESIDYLERKMGEISKLCEFFSARAYINLNRINKSKLGLELLKQTIIKLENNNNFLNILSKSIGSTKTDIRNWVIDIDSHNLELVKEVKLFINTKLSPIGEKTKLILPTPNGFHIVSSPFNLKDFQSKYGNTIVVQKNNPTILYV